MDKETLFLMQKGKKVPLGWQIEIKGEGSADKADTRLVGIYPESKLNHRIHDFKC